MLRFQCVKRCPLFLHNSQPSSKCNLRIKVLDKYQDHYSLSGWTSYHKISWSLEAADSGLDFSNRSAILQAHRQKCFQDVVSSAVEMLVKFQIDAIIITPNLTDSSLYLSPAIYFVVCEENVIYMCIIWLNYPV